MTEAREQSIVTDSRAAMVLIPGMLGDAFSALAKILRDFRKSIYIAKVITRLRYLLVGNLTLLFICGFGVSQASGTVDVQPLNVTLGARSVLAGGSLSVSWQIRNNGTGAAGTSNSQVRITTSNAAGGYGTNLTMWAVSNRPALSVREPRSTKARL